MLHFIVKYGCNCIRLNHNDCYEQKYEQDDNQSDEELANATVPSILAFKAAVRRKFARTDNVQITTIHYTLTNDAQNRTYLLNSVKIWRSY